MSVLMLEMDSREMAGNEGERERGTEKERKRYPHLDSNCHVSSSFSFMIDLKQYLVSPFK